MRVEKHGFKELAADLERADVDINEQVAKVNGKACNNMKRDAQARVRGLAHLPHLPRSYNYDVTTRGDTVTGEVGADHARLQGKLDWVAEYGTPTSAPIGQWAKAGDREIPAWHRYLDDAAVEVIDRD